MKFLLALFLFLFLAIYGFSQTPLGGPIAGGGGISGSFTPWPGSSGQITFKNGGVGAGDANLTWDAGNAVLNVGNDVNTGSLFQIDNAGPLGAGGFDSATYKNNANLAAFERHGGTIAAPLPLNNGSSLLTIAIFGDVSNGAGGTSQNYQFGTISARATTVGTTATSISTIQLSANNGNGIILNGATNAGTPYVEIGDQERLTLNTALQFLQAKVTATAAAPGAGFCNIIPRAGTNAGTGKYVINCGTSATEVTLIDNVGAGF